MLASRKRTMVIVLAGIMVLGFLGIAPALAHIPSPSTVLKVSTAGMYALPYAFAVPTPGGTHIAKLATTCTSTLPKANGASYNPSQIKAAYGYSAATGAGETIAIIDAYGSPTITTDLACFDSVFGLPAANLQVVAPFGKVTTNSGWGLETALDVEWAHAMAPAATILLIETVPQSIAFHSMPQV
jgi:subtilase family serine protease